MIDLRKMLMPVAIGFVVMGFMSCEEDLNTLGEGVIGGEPFDSGLEIFDVFAVNKRLQAVQTNRLPLYQLGTFNDPIYGKTMASITTQLSLPRNANTGAIINTFGDSEDEENEQIKAVYLYLPYQRPPGSRRGVLTDRDGDGVEDALDVDPSDPNSDTDQDGISDIDEIRQNLDPLNPDTDGDGILDAEDDPPVQMNTFTRQLELDSIYGDRSLPFVLKVERSNFFLRDLDPNADFEQAQEYFSNQVFAPTFVTDVLFDGQIESVDDREIVIANNEDDEETTDVDESQSISERADPGIRVALDPDFFQTNLLDKEGSSELVSQANFNDFLRGLHISVEGVNHDIMFLFNLAEAEIDVVYDFDDIVDERETRTERTYTFGFTGNAVNTILTEEIPAQITENLDLEENASRIYIKGGPGIVSEINLFGTEDEAEAIIAQVKANNWVINEANLVFFVDREALRNAGGTVIEPPRLYLFNAETNQPIYDPSTDLGGPQTGTPLGILPTYDGILEESDGLGLKYTIRITEHINDIIVRDSANVPLRLSVSANIADPTVAEAMGTTATINVPQMSTISPLGTILFGNNVASENDDKRLQLQLFFTEAN